MAICRRNESVALRNSRIDMNDIKSFARYSTVGAFVGLVALAVLALSEAIFPVSRISYVLSVIGVYGAGIVLSYVLQKKITFGTGFDVDLKKSFLKFLAVALVGASLTTGLSYALRYHFHWSRELLPLAGPASFAIACLVASLLTFYLNRTWVFKTETPRHLIETSAA